MGEIRRPRKTTKVNNLDELMQKQVGNKKKGRNTQEVRGNGDKAGVPEDWEFQIPDDKTAVSSITQIPQFRKISQRYEKRERKMLKELGLDEYEYDAYKNKNDKQAIEALPYLLKQGASFDTAVLTMASILEGSNSADSSDLKKYGKRSSADKENRSTRKLTSQKEHSLNWAMISIKVAQKVLESGGSDDSAQKIASSIITSGRDSASRGLDANQSIHRAASKVAKVALDSGCTKGMAQAISLLIVKDGEQILSPNYRKMEHDENTNFDDLSQNEQQTMLLSVIEDADKRILKITDDIGAIKESRKSKLARLQKSEKKAAQQKKNIKEQLTRLEDCRHQLDMSLVDGQSYDDGSSYGLEQIREKILATDIDKNKLKKEMKTVSMSVKEKRKQARQVDTMLEAREKALLQKGEHIKREKRRMKKMLQKIKQRIQERKKQGNEIKTETKLIMSEKARLAEKLKILKNELRQTKKKNSHSEKFAAIEAMNNKIGKESKQLEKSQRQRKQYLDSLVQRVQNLEEEKRNLTKNLDDVNDFINEKEIVIQNAGQQRERAEIALIEQIGEVEEERIKYMDLVQQAKQDEADRHHFEHLLQKEQAAAEKDRIRLNDRIKQVQQTEAIFKNREEAFRNRLVTANLEIMSNWKEQQRKEQEYNQNKKVAFNLDVDEGSEMSPEKLFMANASGGTFSTDGDDRSVFSEEDNFDDDASSLSSLSNGNMNLHDDEDLVDIANYDKANSSNKADFMKYRRHKNANSKLKRDPTIEDEGIEIVYSVSAESYDLHAAESKESFEISLSNRKDYDEFDDIKGILDTIGECDENQEKDWFDSADDWAEENREKIQQTMAELGDCSSLDSAGETKKKSRRRGFKFGRFILQKRKPIKDTAENFRSRELEARENMIKSTFNSSEMVYNHSGLSLKLNGKGNPEKKKKMSIGFFGKKLKR